MLTVSKSEQLTFESNLNDYIYFQLTEILSDWKKEKLVIWSGEVYVTDKPNIQQSLIFLFFMFELCKKRLPISLWGEVLWLKTNLSIKGIAPWIKMAPHGTHTVT